mgnify:CR=1 FL=1
MLNDIEFNTIVEGCEERELQALWLEVSSQLEYATWRHKLPTFASQKEAFLSVVERLMDSERLILIEGAPSQDVTPKELSPFERLRREFPKGEDEMDSGTWFLLETCPVRPQWKA